MSGAAASADPEGGSELTPLLASFVALLPVEHAAASSLRGPFDIETLAATSERAAAIDEAQIDLGEGPAWEALRDCRPVQMRLDVEKDCASRPFLSASPALAGVSYVLAVPLGFGPLPIGAVSLSSSASVSIGSEQLQLAEGLASVLGRAVVAQAIAEAEGGGMLRDPGLSRREVHQATGMVISQTRSTPADALLMIRAHAFSSGTSVRRTATEIVARRLDFTPDHSGDDK